ncbi:MAG TPA: RagB/SusD family nutrient uptake outer membrane protein [Mucilaginibacter sp.]
MKKKYLLIIGIILFSSYACKKSALYPALESSVASSQNFISSDRIIALVNGLYTTIRSTALYGGNYEIYNEVKCDNWINATANSNATYQTWTETVSSTSSEVTSLWAQCYLAINDCNVFIDGMNNGGTAVVGTALATNYIGEAKFIRAAAYYALLQMYCQAYTLNGGTSPGLPLRLTGNSVYGNSALAPVSVAAIYAQVIADLNAAETSLPLTYADASTNTTRAHRNTAIAFKTRVYLSMGLYSNVITEANKIVSATAPYTATSGVAFALQPVIANVFKAPYTTTESILSMPFFTTETRGNEGDYFNSVGTANYYLNPAGIIADPNWKTTDARRAFINLVTKVNHYYLTKYPLTPYTDWANVMRYSEVLLNLSEARVRSTGTLDAQAIALLNAVHTRSDPTTTFTTASFPAGVDDFYAKIAEERNIEFLGEGLRWSDLLRLQLPIPAKSNVPSIPVTSAAYIWPISNNEELYNPLIGR